MKIITISFYDSVTLEPLGGTSAPYKKIDMIRCRWSKYIKLHKKMMTNTYRRHGMLIGEIKFKIEVTH